MNVVPAVPPGKGVRDRVVAAVPEGEEKTEDHPGIAHTGTAHPGTAHSVTVSARTVQGTDVRGQLVRRSTDRQTHETASNASHRIGLPPSEAGTVRGRVPMNGDGPVVPMTSVPGTTDASGDQIDRTGLLIMIASHRAEGQLKHPPQNRWLMI